MRQLLLRLLFIAVFIGIVSQEISQQAFAEEAVGDQSIHCDIREAAIFVRNLTPDYQHVNDALAGQMRDLRTGTLANIGDIPIRNCILRIDFSHQLLSLNNPSKENATYFDFTYASGEIESYCSIFLGENENPNVAFERVIDCLFHFFLPFDSADQIVRAYERLMIYDRLARNASPSIEDNMIRAYITDEELRFIAQALSEARET